MLCAIILATTFKDSIYYPHFTEDKMEGAQRCCCLVVWSCLILCELWTEAHEAPLSMGFSRQEYWSGLPFSSPGALHHTGIELAWQVDSEPSGKPPQRCP